MSCIKMFIVFLDFLKIPLKKKQKTTFFLLL